MSRERLVRIAVAFGLAAALLCVALVRLQVVDHEVWLERSYRNRWAFRDVPTRRGEIVDRNGLPLAWDAPGFDLELTYLGFRRQHPLGLVRHAAELLHEARGGAVRYPYAEPARFAAALDDLLGMPLAWLREPGAWPRADLVRGYREDGDARAEPVMRDLRIQLVGAVAALAGVPRSALAQSFAAAAADPGRGGRVLDTLVGLAAGEPRFAALRGPAAELRARLQAALAARIDELQQIDAGLLLRAAAGGVDGADWSLFAGLDEAQVDWAVWRRLLELPDEEVEVLVQPDFWRFLAVRGRTWDGWEDWRRWPEPERRDLVADFEPERERRDRARLAEIVGLRGFVDPEFSADGGDRLFDEPPAGLAVPRFADEARPVRLRSRVAHEVAVRLALLAERHPGFSLRPSVRRERGSLPGRDDLGSLVGLVGTVGTYLPGARSPALDAVRQVGEADDFARVDDGLPTDLEAALRRTAASVMRRHYAIHGRVGHSGIEAAMDEVLSGRPGLRFVERDKRARETRMFDSLDVSPGAAVTATVDLHLQRLAEAALGLPGPGTELALAVIDPHTGDVLALAGRRNQVDASQPAGRDSWTLGAMQPGSNAAVGSVAKPLVALEYLRALRVGAADAAAPLVPPSAFPVCAGRWVPEAEIPYRGRPLYCGTSAAPDHHHHHEGSRSTAEAIAESCNVYFFEAASRLGPRGLRRAYARFGWDPGQPGDGIPDGTYQDRLAGLIRIGKGGPFLQEPRAGGQPVPMRGIGYELEVWPVFVARAYAGIATGALPALRVVRELPAARLPLPYTAEEFAEVREGLALCVSRGTAQGELGAFAERLAREHGVSLFGKTGTAEVRRARRDPPRSDLNNAWFAGYLADGQGPVLAFAAVDYRTGDTGGQAAAPIVRRFFEAVAGDPELARIHLGRGER
jgi:penicillin-binding protein 2